MPKSDVLKAIAATSELCGKTFSTAAAAVFAEDLSGFPEDAVLRALTRCRKELKAPLTVEAVTSRIDDGRLGVETAWAMLPHDESTSVVWSEEMAKAWGIAQRLLTEGDRIGARMAFKESYVELVTEARDRNEPPKWTVSFGTDVHGRQTALEDAVRNYRLPLDHAIRLLPPEAAEGLVLSLGVTKHPLLAAPNVAGKEKVKELLLTLKGKGV